MGWVVAVATVLRVWAVGTLPLIITNDGVGYLVWARQLQENGLGSFQMLPWRTPGYPLFLSLVFEVFGVGPLGVLVSQHLLGVLTCALVAWLACRLGSPRLGTVAGLLCCLDPWLLLFGSFALSETLATALTVLSITLILAPRRPSIPLGLAIGACLGTLALVRPMFQILWPFLALAWLIRPQDRGLRMADGESATPGASAALPRSRLALRNRWLCTAALAVGLLAAVTPWAVHKHRQSGSLRLARGSGAFFWWGVQRYGMIDPALCPAEVRNAYTPWADQPMLDDDFLAFSGQIDGMGSRERLLQRWAWESIGRRPLVYLKKFAEASGRQLNWYHRSMGEMDWYLQHVGTGGSAMCFVGDTKQVEAFLIPAGGGWLRDWFRLVAKNRVPAFPQLALAIGALAFVVLAFLNRQWDVAIVFAGTMAFVAAHAALLSWTSRFALPMWVSWYVMAAAIPESIRALRERRRRRVRAATARERHALRASHALAEVQERAFP